jgi:hypothetical protein
MRREEVAVGAYGGAKKERFLQTQVEFFATNK